MTTNKIKNINQFYRNELGGSCGARIYTACKTLAHQRNSGIKVILGQVGEEMKNERDSVTHIQTKNGPLTIGLRSQK